jgi:hypothetical protein
MLPEHRIENPVHMRIALFRDEAAFLTNALDQFKHGLRTSAKQSDRELFYKTTCESIIERRTKLVVEVNSLTDNLSKDYLHPLITKAELSSARDIIKCNIVFLNLTIKQQDEIVKEIDTALLIYDKTLN